MTRHLTESRIVLVLGKIRGRTRGWLLTGLCGLMAGCAGTGGPPPGDQGALDPESEAFETLADSLVQTPWDEEVSLPAELAALQPAPVPLAIGPDGYASLADLEELFSIALAMAADGTTDLAEDHLFALEDQLLKPLPDYADSAYVGQVGSLQRRAHLLWAVLAEQGAFGEPVTERDSLLTAAYSRLQATGFPDSLVPATGTHLPGIVADLLKCENQAVDHWLRYFTGPGRKVYQLWLDRKGAVDSLITSILVENGLPPQLIYLSMIESGISTRAVSSAKAVGPWQFMSDTAKAHGLRVNWWVDERRDFELATRAACAYLGELHAQFGDWSLVLAAYNTGENRIARKIREHGHDNFWAMPLSAQTTDFVPKFIAAARVGEDPLKYGFVLNEATPLRYDVITVDVPTDLDLIADCAGVPAPMILELNPALLRGASPPDMANYPVRVPHGSGSRTQVALAKVPADQRLTWSRHKVARGETLGQIARRYGTNVQDIARLNNLGNVHLIQPGDLLLIPMPGELAAKATKRATDKGRYVPPDGYARVTYKVKRGDTLGGIAQKLGVTLAHLRKVNNLKTSNLIRPGQMLFAYRPQG